MFIIGPLGYLDGLNYLEGIKMEEKPKQLSKKEILERYEELNFELDKQKSFVASCANAQLYHPIQEMVRLYDELVKLRSYLTLEDLNG